MFSVGLTSKLTGASRAQLQHWRTKGLLVPEARQTKPMMYSFRDLVALRTMVWLRAEVSLQRITKAWEALDVFDLADHPSAYKFGTDGDTIFVDTPRGPLDLVKRRGEISMFAFTDIAAGFKNRQGVDVVPFNQPAAYLEVRPQRMGGVPTITGTRIPYSAIADLVDDETITIDDVPDYFPGVSPEAARSAIQFYADVIGAA